MNRRVVAAIIAIALTITATGLLALYVANADERAIADLEPTEVLVVTQPVPAGAPVVAGTNVEIQELPLSALADGAVTSENQIGDRVALVDLVVGEQLLASRLGVEENLDTEELVIPPELAQVTIQVDAQQALAARLQPGDTVGVTLAWAQPIPAAATIQHRVLVSAIDVIAETVNPDEPGAQGSPGPVTAVFVTLAADPIDVEKIVWGQVHGTVWLSTEGEDTIVTPTPVLVQEGLALLASPDLPVSEAQPDPTTEGDGG